VRQQAYEAATRFQQLQGEINKQRVACSIPQTKQFAPDRNCADAQGKWWIGQYKVDIAVECFELVADVINIAGKQRAFVTGGSTNAKYGIS
jgi:hypothetical protein